MATNNKIKFPFWVTPKTMETVKEMYKDDDCRSQSEFIEKAIHAYCFLLSTMGAGRL